MSRSAPKDRPPDLCTLPAGVATYAPREKGTAREEDRARRLLRLRSARTLRTRLCERELRNHRGHRRTRRPDHVLLDAQRPGREREPDRDLLGPVAADAHP